MKKSAKKKPTPRDPYPVKPVPDGMTIDQLLRFWKGEEVQTTMLFPQ